MPEPPTRMRLRRVAEGVEYRDLRDKNASRTAPRYRDSRDIRRPTALYRDLRDKPASHGKVNVPGTPTCNYRDLGDHEHREPRGEIPGTEGQDRELRDIIPGSEGQTTGI